MRSDITPHFYVFALIAMAKTYGKATDTIRFLGTVSNKYKQDSAALMLAINVHFDYNKNEYEQHLKVVVVGMNVKKWYDEEYEFEIEVTGFLRGNRTVWQKF